jgi:hypothetical protein
MLEYAWNVSPSNAVKCDPCVAAAPSTQDLVQAGVWWVGSRRNGYDPENDNADDVGKVYFTRLHVRYNRKAFPQDLFFQETANNTSFQARYIITHPATGDLSCDAGRKYLKELKERRKDELKMLTYLTGKGFDDWDVVASREEEKSLPEADSYAAIAADIRKYPPVGHGMMIAGIGVLGVLSLIGIAIRGRWKT